MIHKKTVKKIAAVMLAAILIDNCALSAYAGEDVTLTGNDMIYAGTGGTEEGEDIEDDNNLRDLNEVGDESSDEGVYIIDFVAGSYHNAVLTSTGELYMWGLNDARQIVNSSANSINSPKKIGSGYKDVELGYETTGVINDEHEFWLWGLNDYFERQSEDGKSIPPTKMMENVEKASIGGYHRGAVVDGVLYLWGSNEYGERSDSSKEIREVSDPVAVTLPGGIEEVCLAGSSSAAITKNGELYTWGANHSGELGIGKTTKTVSTPTKVNIEGRIRQVRIDSATGVAVTEDGRLYMWGNNDYGQLGDGTKSRSISPKQVNLGSPVRSADVGGDFAAAVTVGGDLYTWGADHYLNYGQLGDGNTTGRLKPGKIMSGVYEVSAGYSHCMALMNDGSIMTWGNNTNGQLGDGTTEDSHVPRKIDVKGYTPKPVPVPKGKITYNGNGAVFGKAPVDKTEYPIGSEAMVLGRGTLGFFGQRFLGWSENMQAETGEYDPDDPSKKNTIEINKPVTKLYAIWDRAKGNEILPNVYHTVSEDPASYGDSSKIPPYYMFELQDKTTTLNISVSFNTQLSKKENIIHIYDARGKAVSLFDDSSGEVTNPYNDSILTGDTILFRRIVLPKGKYYISVQNTQDWSYGFSESDGGIFITTYRRDGKGFDLTQDALPLLNNPDYLAKGYGKYLPARFYVDVYGIDQTREYKLYDHKPGGYCVGFNVIANKVYGSRTAEEPDSEFMANIPENYLTDGYNINKQGYDYNENGFPRLDAYSGLLTLLGDYSVLQYSCHWYDHLMNNSIIQAQEQDRIDISQLSAFEEDWNKGTPMLLIFNNHVATLDSCRVKLKNPGGRGNTWVRYYFYDCNNPYFESVSRTAHSERFGTGSSYMNSEYRYLDIDTVTGEWRAPGIAKNAGDKANDLSNENSELRVVGSIDSLRSSFDGKEEYPQKDKEGKNFLVRLLNVDKCSIKDASDSDVSHYKKNAVPICGEPVNDSKDTMNCMFELPDDNYLFDFTGGAVELSKGPDMIRVESEGRVSAKMGSATSVELTSSDNSDVSLMIVDSAATNESYSKLETTVHCSGNPVSIGVNDGKVSIITENPQTIDLTLEAETGSGKISGISTSEINGLIIEDYVTEKYYVDFDACGGSVVDPLLYVEPGSRVNLPIPQKEGASFAGWFTKPDGEGKRYTDETPISKSVLLYACWDSKGLNVYGLNDAYNYSGSAIRPAVTVYDGGTLLKAGSDYSISYKNNTGAYRLAEGDAGFSEKKAPCIIITGKGNYRSKETLFFKILPKDISGYDFEADDITLAATGKKQKVTPGLCMKGKALKCGRDYDFDIFKAEDTEYDNPLGTSVEEAGGYIVRITGKINYSGCRIIDLNVTGDFKTVDKLSVGKIRKQQYTGNSIEPEPVVKDGKKELVKDTHYTLSYQDNTEVGTGYVFITGKPENGYGGTKRISFGITGTPLRKAVISGIPKSVKYTGNEISLDDKIVLTAGEALAAGKDYRISYSQNTNVGDATVILTGIGGMMGTIKKKFKITPYDMSPASDTDERVKVICDAAAEYSKGGARPAVSVTFTDFDGNVKELVAEKDYILSYQFNTVVNGAQQPTVTVTGKGNFKGKKSAGFAITQKNIECVTLIADDKVFEPRDGNYATSLSLVDTDGKKLKAGVDYEEKPDYFYVEDTDVTTDGEAVKRFADENVGSGDMIPAGTKIKVTVTAKGNNYTGKVSGIYRITSLSISSARISIPAQTYTGHATRVDPKTITVRVKGKDLVPYDEATGMGDFEITGYSDNVNKGTASLTIMGRGNYGSTKTQTYKIKARDFRWWWR